MIGGVLAWLIFGEEKGYALGAGIIAIYLLRFLVIEHEKA